MKRFYFFILTFFLFFCFLDFSFSREDDSSREETSDENEAVESSRPDDAKIDDTPSLEYDDTSGQSEDNLVEINDLNENEDDDNGVVEDDNNDNDDNGGSSSSGGGGGGGGSSGSSSSKENTLKEIDFSQETLEIEKGETINFKINEKSHSIYLNDFSSSGANITLSSTPINFFLKFLEVKTFDLDENGIDDIKLSLYSIYSNSIVLNIENLELKKTQDNTNYFGEENSNSNRENQNEEIFFDNNNQNSNLDNNQNQNEESKKEQQKENILEENKNEQSSLNIFLYILCFILFLILVGLGTFYYFKFYKKKDYPIFSFKDFKIYKYIENEEKELFTDKVIQKYLEKYGITDIKFFEIKKLVENNYFYYVKNKDEWKVYEYIIHSLNKGEKEFSIINKLEESKWDRVWVQDLISKIDNYQNNIVNQNK